MARALMSVYNKARIEEVGARLEAAGLEIIATGGTSRALTESGIRVTDVSDITGFPEMLDGRVKTLHPSIHGGLLARRDIPDHQSQLSQHNIQPIDVLVSNLYPFAQVIGREDVSEADAIENIDIGGPAMLRSAAKNYPGVIVLSDPADYDEILSKIEAGGIDTVDERTRRRLAVKAFSHVSVYDSLIANYLREDDGFPVELSVGGTLLAETRYGENPHQQAAIYSVAQPGGPAGVATWQVHAGKELSYNNYLDANSAWGCAQQFSESAIVIVKHTLPCGVGLAAALPEAYRKALSGDPVSAFGGILAANKVIDEATVEAIGRQRLDVMIAPGYSDAALQKLERRRNLRIVIVGNTSATNGWEYRSLPGGLLVQETDPGGLDRQSWKVVTDRQPTETEWSSLEFAWRVIPWVKSNAIVLAQEGVVTGIGAGQPNRVESVRIAVQVAGERATGSVLASDAFFPFADGVEAAAQAGVSAIVQPGGSVRDDDTIAAANAADMAMVLTGRRHFRH